MHGLQEIPLSLVITAESVFLKEIHKDPADRFIVATALEKNLKIVTPDEEIRSYPGVEVLW